MDVPFFYTRNSLLVCSHPGNSIKRDFFKMIPKPRVCSIILKIVKIQPPVVKRTFIRMNNEFGTQFMYCLLGYWQNIIAEIVKLLKNFLKQWLFGFSKWEEVEICNMVCQQITIGFFCRTKLFVFFVPIPTLALIFRILCRGQLRCNYRCSKC